MVPNPDKCLKNLLPKDDEWTDFFLGKTWEQDNDKFRMITKALSINKYIKVSFNNLTLR